ncbi:Flp pilus assembly protein CpaB [Acidicapsa dinghuensis]|uniref:Flp pilus assembly protein CpaB n=1 Tax=Acidicapsa dinghuensis TaxID=2218256 RepID=A0ABW1EHZ2_9BACT|nr:Flp pilus assembly protein CpaB [Acidicapsa dinghuensis]
MNRRLLTILFSAFVIAAICALMVWRMVGSRLQAATKQSATVSVVAAANDIKLGKVLTPSDITTVEIAGPLPKGALLKPDQAVGRGVVSDLYQGEPILDERLAPVGSGGGLAATIPAGMRACAVKVDEVVGVAGFVTPGMHVDVLISGDPPGRENVNTTGQKVKTLLQNILVLSAGTDIQKDKEGKPQQVQVVNLQVSPEQAELLSLASSQTHIQLVLRNPLDTQLAQTSGTFVSNLFADSKTPTPSKTRPVAIVVKKAPPAYTVEVINGALRSNQKFSTPEGQK